MSCILKDTKECKNKNCNKAVEKVCPSFSTKIKVDTEGRQIFNVPHNEEGKTFLALCKKYLNSPRYRLVKRGRAKNRPKFKECGYNSAPSLRVKDSDWFAVYPNYKPTKEDKARKDLEYKRYTERWANRTVIQNKIKELDELIKTIVV